MPNPFRPQPRSACLGSLASLLLFALTGLGWAAAAGTNQWAYTTHLALDCDSPTALARLLFPEGRRKALTLSFDDGRIMDRRLVKILNLHGLRGTFNLVSSCLDRPGYITRAELKDLYHGHEVACHTVTHPPLTRQTEDGITREVMENRQDLEHLVGYPIRGLAYPGGDCDQRVAAFLPRLGIAYARTVGATTWMAMPKNPLLWAATGHHATCLKDGDRLLTWTTYPALLSVWGHSYEFEEAKNWELIEEFARKMSGRADIWYATNIEIVDYLAAAKRLNVSASGDLIQNPSALPLWLEYQGRPVRLPPGEITPLATSGDEAHRQP